MSELDILGSRLACRIGAELPMLAPMGSIDVHIDEIVTRPLCAQELVEMSVGLFDWTTSHLGGVLSDMVVLLLIPLRASGVLVRAPPSWVDVPRQISATPPSIYVMSPEALLQPDLAERYVSPMTVTMTRSLVASYHCWRVPGDDVEDGWARDVRSVFIGFIRRRLNVPGMDTT